MLNDYDDSKNNQHLADIASALGLRNTVLLHERCFVGVEGPTEQQAFPILFRLSTGRSLQSCGVVIIACNNNEGALHFVSFMKRNDRQVLLVVDADSRQNKLFKDARLIAAKLDPKTDVHWLGSPDKELEFLFADDQWASTANKAWPRDDALPWTAEQIAQLREQPKFSKALEDLFREHSERGPTSKTALVYEVACSLGSAEDVPQPLRDAFTHVEQLAMLDG